ncbi:hypothetical protein [Anaeromicropila populeti]|uniref:Integrase core domain-containing protein n=1 Tax=Anaeromicropila populeti TaxID=37658 RepID=A0A1I6J196_9FIRM|nr:hypothetical protein [Anaeromicropila populeti]SFR72709.1 hypothetical protein SAMN05661086_01341 [Anaeromicropila populeti]
MWKGNEKMVKNLKKKEGNRGESHVNDCWLTGELAGPVVLLNGCRTKTSLLFIEDYVSEMLLYGELFLTDGPCTVKNATKSALKTYGIPEKIVMAKQYFSEMSRFYKVFEGIGICTVYVDEKLFFRKVNRWKECFTKWKCRMERGRYASLKELNYLFLKMYYREYFNAIQPNYKMTPRERFLLDIDEIVFLDPAAVEESFNKKII